MRKLLLFILFSFIYHYSLAQKTISELKNLRKKAGNQDCVTKKPICSTASFDDNNGGSGTVNDLTPATRGCLGAADGLPEHQSSWYYFRVSTGGTFNFLLNTVAGADDYDFAVWGPNPNCPPTTAPIRCNYSLTPGLTGLSPAALNNSEGAGGPPFSKEMNVLAGQIYILMIDNFSASNQGFEISFSGTATLDCGIVVPMDMLSLSVRQDNEYVDIYWQAISDASTDHFIVEKSVDGINFRAAGQQIKTEGIAGTPHSYKFRDPETIKGTVLYYRLRSVDLKGNSSYSEVVPVVLSDQSTGLTSVYPNPAGKKNPLININYALPGPEAISVRVVDGVGMTVFWTEKIGAEGTNTITIDSGLWKPGLYFMEISAGSQITRRKIQVTE